MEVLSIAAGCCSVLVTACVMCALNVQVPNGAAGYYLLGKICKMTKRPEKAIEHFATALRQDVLLWSAYEELCSLGRVAIVSQLFDRLVRPLRDAESMRLHGMPATFLKGQRVRQLLDSAATQQAALMALTSQHTLAAWP